MHLDKAHLLHYIILFVFGGVTIVIIDTLPLDKNGQLGVITLCCFGYALYNLYHHKVHHDLTRKIVIEYILVSLLALSLFVMIRGGF